jgi:hypothetical protein
MLYSGMLALRRRSKEVLYSVKPRRSLSGITQVSLSLARARARSLSLSRSLARSPLNQKKKKPLCDSANSN